MGAFGRTALQLNSGGKTQLTSLISVLVVVLTLLFLTKVFYYLPKVILASIVTFAVSSLVDLEEIQKLSKFNKVDMCLLLITFFMTLGLGVQSGILTAVGLSVILIIFQCSRPNAYVCGRLPGTTTYTDVSSSPEAIRSPGVILFRFDAPIIFCNSYFFKRKFNESLEDADDQVKAIVLDCASVSLVDSTGIKYLKEMIRELNDKKIVVVFADVRSTVISTFKKSGVFKDAGANHFFLRVHDAMKAVGAQRVVINPITEDPAGIKWNCFRYKTEEHFEEVL